MIEVRKLAKPGGWTCERACRSRKSRGARDWREAPSRFALGEAFPFDWSTKYAFVGGLRRRLAVAHTKLCASRAFWLVAYPTQSHEMLLDAHARAFAAFGGVPQRGIYDNMKPPSTKSVWAKSASSTRASRR